MKTTTRWIAAIALSAGVLVVVLCIRSARLAPGFSMPPRHASAASLSAPLPSEAAAPIEKDGPIVVMDHFGARFGLSQVEVFNVSDRVRNRMNEWREEKGAAARIVSAEGKALRMFIPALGLSPAQLRQEVERVVATAIGPARARLVCGSEQGWKTLVHWGALDLLLMDQDCTFTRIKEEGRVDQQEFAVFTVSIDQQDVSKGEMPQYENEAQLIDGFDYNWLAGSNLLSWTALAKAPVGYFRSEPILGVASAPKPIVTVIENWDTGKVTIHNLRGRGSVEHADLNDKRPPAP